MMWASGVVPMALSSGGHMKENQWWRLRTWCFTWARRMMRPASERIGTRVWTLQAGSEGGSEGGREAGEQGGDRKEIFRHDDVNGYHG